MRIVLSTLHFANLRNYESAIWALAQRGHHIHIVADESEQLGGAALVRRLTDSFATVTASMAPVPDEPWSPFAQKIRYALDYARFLAPRYDDVPKLRLRNVERAPRVVRWLTSGVGRAIVGHRATSRLLQWLERQLPPSPAMVRFLQDLRPDVLLLTALTFSRSSQLEQLKAARAAGIRTAACILSWDHLSSKSLLHIPPDRVVVWNDVQKQEAIDMHGLPADRIIVTGAQCYDQWFDRHPSRSREEFCRSLGLDPARRIILYVCSTMSPPPDPLEPVFVRRWLDAIRTSAESELREASVVVRPHPERVREWKGITLDGVAHAVLHGRSPIDAEAKADYFDSLYYSDAVVGLCTTAFIEAAIVGRPVLTLLLPEYRIHQDGMAHFRYLVDVAGGILRTSTDLESHLVELSAIISRAGADDERSRRFVEAFVRPFGLDRPATPAFVNAVEQMASTPVPAPDPQFARATLATGVVTRLAARTRAGVLRWLMLDAIDLERERFEHGREERKGAIVTERALKREAKARLVAEQLEHKARQRQAKAETRARRHPGVGDETRVSRFKRGLKQLLRMSPT